MTRYHAPQGKQVVIAALALVLGVALLAADVPAAEYTSGGDSFYSGSGGVNKGGGTNGLPNPGPDSEADPDWWQTDTWAGNEIGEAPVPVRPLPDLTLYRPYSVAGFGGILAWLAQWTVGLFGIGSAVVF